VGFLTVVVFCFCLGKSEGARSFLSASAKVNLLPRDFDEEARGASDSESPEISAILRETRRFGFGGEGEGERFASLPLASSSADTLADALESERTAVNGRR
jgi:hypothetical protein